MLLVEAGGRHILLDCGLNRSPQTESPVRLFPFDPRSIDAVVLTHAHIDHSGSLPDLVALGFEGPIYCTEPTRDLTRWMLLDSVKIHDGTWTEARESLVESPQDAAIEDLLARCVVVEYGQPFELGDARWTLEDAGHILGSAMVHVRGANASGEGSLTFTGDLGREELPLHGPPGAIPPADLLICESTYGGQRHDPWPETRARFLQIVRETVAREGTVVIPAFSLGRTQFVLHILEEAIHQGELEPLPIAVDSPLATRITDVYRQHAGRLRGLDPRRPFLDHTRIQFVRGWSERDELLFRAGPGVIVASSGMCEGGRVVGHLRRRIDDPRASVILVSYQAPGTLGARLLERGPKVRIRDRYCNRWADVHVLRGFSSHADQEGIASALAPLAGRIVQGRLVHGEAEASAALLERLNGLGLPAMAIASRGERLVVRGH